MVGARLDSPNSDPMDRTVSLSRAEQLDVREIQADVREAYERGRKDERASRRRHPIFMTLTFIAAICGVALLALAAVNGSFERGGSVADESINALVNQAQAQRSASQSLGDSDAAARVKADELAG
jgi:hypothetical protein